jgi:hypothetical protein
MAVVDLNADGHLDIVNTTLFTNEVTYSFGNGAARSRIRSRLRAAANLRSQLRSPTWRA